MITADNGGGSWRRPKGSQRRVAVGDSVCQDCCYCCRGDVQSCRKEETMNSSRQDGEMVMRPPNRRGGGE